MSLGITAMWAAVLVSIASIIRFDRDLLNRGIPSLGVVVVSTYALTYGVGLTLWRLDPSSLFGYGTISTIGSLESLSWLFAMGLPSLSFSYSFLRNILSRSHFFRPPDSFLNLATTNFKVLRRLCFCLVLLCVVGLLGMTSAGLFARDHLQQQQALQSSWFAKLLIGTALMSRLAPVALLLIPLVARSWSWLQRFSIGVCLATWAFLVLASSSRGQLLGLPMYLLIGALIWRRLRFKHALVLLVLGAALFLPVAEVIRVNRAGVQDKPQLQNKYQVFQIGKQLMGTSHEFYLLLNPDNCRADLELQLEKDPEASRLLGVPATSLAPVPGERWNVVRLFESCIKHPPSFRGFSGFDSIPLGFFPNTFFPGAPSLFDGQQLVKTLSQNLGLHPGEISQGTLSVFADSWWRWRWLGVVIASATFGFILAFIQELLLFLMRNQPLAGILGQLLVLSLVGTWINNTVLTTLWYLIWELPKALIELILLATLLRLRLPSGAP